MEEETKTQKGNLCYNVEERTPDKEAELCEVLILTLTNQP